MYTRSKCLEYYFDSKNYSFQDVQENIEKNKKEFPNKFIEAKIELNSYGVYVVNIYFMDKKSKYKNNFSKMIKLER